MRSPLVQARYRPTLNDLLGARWRAIPRALRIAAVAVVVVVAAVLLIGRETSAQVRHPVIVYGHNPANFVFAAPLVRVKPGPGETARVATPPGAPEPEHFSVRPLTLPRYGGDPGGALPIASVALERQLQRIYPNFVVRDEGRQRVNNAPAFQVTFQTTYRGHTAFGRDIMVLPDLNGSRVGATLEMFSILSKHVPKADALGSTRPLKLPLTSFRLGTQRP